MLIRNGSNCYFIPERASPKPFGELMQVSEWLMFGEVNRVFCTDIRGIGEGILKEVLKPYSNVQLVK